MSISQLIGLFSLVTSMRRNWSVYKRMEMYDWSIINSIIHTWIYKYVMVVRILLLFRGSFACKTNPESFEFGYQRY